MSDTYKHKIQAEASIKRLLESVVADAMQYERDRIIKLLLEFDAQDDDRMLVLELVKEIEK